MNNEQVNQPATNNDKVAAIKELLGQTKSVQAGTNGAGPRGKHSLGSPIRQHRLVLRLSANQTVDGLTEIVSSSSLHSRQESICVWLRRRP